MDFQHHRPFLEKIKWILVRIPIYSRRCFARFFVPESWRIVCWVIEDEIKIVVPESLFDEIVVISGDNQRILILRLVGLGQREFGKESIYGCGFVLGLEYTP
jgi:hypothetical protein